MLRPEEVEILVCGTPKLDLRELQKNTVEMTFHLHKKKEIFFYVVIAGIRRLQSHGPCHQVSHQHEP